MAMLDEGTARRTSLQISDQLAQLGANLGTGSKLDASSVSLEALKENLDASLDIYGDVILHPDLSPHRFRAAEEAAAGADPAGKSGPSRAWRCGSSPDCCMGRTMPMPTHGPDRARRSPRPGSSARTWSAFTRPGSSPTMPRWWSSGATTMAEIKPKLERLFAAWKPGEVPAKNIATVGQQPRPRGLLDRSARIAAVGDSSPATSLPPRPTRRRSPSRR